MGSVKRIAPMAATAALCSLAAVVRASPEPASGSEQTQHRTGGAPSRSLGWPWRGALTGSVRLTESHLLRYAESEVADGHFYGTSELVHILERGVRKVQRQAPGGRLTVGELSRAHGGDIVGHRSHENGRDADLGFYVTDGEGQPVETPDFVRINWRGEGELDGTTVRFDERRNWLLVKALMTDEHTTLKHVFVAPHIRRRLLEAAREQGESDTLIERAKHVVLPPGVRHPHADHYHIRIYCPAGDVPGCHDKGPFWPWLPETHPFADRPAPPVLAGGD